MSSSSAARILYQPASPGIKEMTLLWFSVYALPSLLVALPALVHLVVVVYFVTWGFSDHTNSVSSNPNTCVHRLVAVNFQVSFYCSPLSTKLNGPIPWASLCQGGWIFFLVHPLTEDYQFTRYTVEGWKGSHF